MAVLVLLQFPTVQTSIIKSITDSVSDKLDGKISIGKVYYLFFNKLILTDVSITSAQSSPLLDSLKKNFNHTDTLLSCNKVSLTFSTSDLATLDLRIKKVVLEEGEFNLFNEREIDNERYSNLDRIFKRDKNRQKDTTDGIDLKMLASSVKISDFRFRLNNPFKETFKGDSIINFADLDITGINVNISNVKLENDTLYATVRNISGKDKSGFRLNTLTGNLKIWNRQALLTDLIIEDAYSTVRGKYFYMKYNSSKDFKEYVNLVEMGLNSQDSYLSFKTIGRITPTLYNSNMAMYVTGEVEGPVKDLRSESIRISSVTGQTFLDIAVRLIGLPDVRSAMAVAEINNGYTTTNDISRIVSSINNTPKKKLFQILSPFEQYNVYGTLTGLLNDFVGDIEIQSSVGVANVDLLFRDEPGDRGQYFSGHVSTDQFNIGQIIQTPILGHVTMDATVEAKIAKEWYGGNNIKLHKLKIKELDFNKYKYRDIFAEGTYTSNSFDGKIVSNDPNLNMMFQGLFTFNKESSNKYKFYADIPYANLKELNIDNRFEKLEISMNVQSNFVKTHDNNIVGYVNVEDAHLNNSNNKYHFDRIRLSSAENHRDSIYTASVESPFIKAKYKGKATIIDFIKRIKEIAIASKIDNFLQDNRIRKHSIGEYELDIVTNNSIGICDVLMPGLYIHQDTKLKINVDKRNNLEAALNSKRVAYEKNFFKNLNLKVSSTDSTLVNLYSDNIRLAGIAMDSSKINLKITNNLLKANFRFKNDSLSENNAYINLSAQFKPDKHIDVNIDNRSHFNIKGKTWNLNNANIDYCDTLIRISDFKIINDLQSLEAGGTIAKSGKDSLGIKLSNFDIDILNAFLNKPFNFKGYFSGSAKLSELHTQPKVFLDLTGDSVMVYNNNAGRMKIMSIWNDNLKRFNILVNSKLNNKTVFTTQGYYIPKNGYLNLVASLDNLSVAYFEPFLSSVISKSSGSLSGDLKLYGTFKELKLIGDNCMFKDFKFTVNFTQVPYILNGPVMVNENGIFSKDLYITDMRGYKGKVTGKMGYNYFRDIFFDVEIDFNDMECLRTTLSHNDAFYGNAFGSGKLKITGPLKKINLDIDVITKKNTSIHIPLSSTENATRTNILTFVEHEDTDIDPYDSILVKKSKKVTPTELNVKMKANVTPDAEMFIEVNKELGDVIKARGTGLIDLHVNPTVDIFDIYGNYIVDQGSYRFVFGGIATKDFILDKGGVINFNGGIEDTNLDLKAIYRTKTSINTLIADTSSVSSRKNVNCEILMSGKMMNPELDFKIDIPDLDPTTKMRVESALNTSGKIQKQFMALIVSGGFIPDEQSGIANNSSIFYSNASEILSNQISNVIQQLGIPLDLGLNYQHGTGGVNVFDVAVSTQLFNNRVLINGNIGNDPYSASSNRDVIGNIDVEVKLDNEGKIRLNMFSHAEDQYSSYSDNGSGQRNGVGIMYQKEFNSFGELFRKKSDAEKLFIKQEKERIKREKKLEKEQKRKQKEPEAKN